MEQRLGSLSTEQAHQAVPGDRAQPLHSGGQRNALTEGKPRKRQLRHSSLGPPRGQDGDGECPETYADHDAEETRPEPQPQCPGQRPGEDTDSSIFGANHTVKFRRERP